MKSCTQRYAHEYYERNSERMNAQSRLWREQNKEQHTRLTQKWCVTHPKRYAYLNQRGHAKARGIAFNLTFTEWVGFWGADFSRRGRRGSDLVMARYEDSGPYQVGNIYKATKSENGIGPRNKAV